MHQSLEVRWFGDRPLAPADRRWFESIAGESFRRSEERTDRYVDLPGVTDLGLKFRGDQGVDLKARLEEIGTVELRLGDVIAGGRAESWAKWSYQGSEYMALGGVLSRLDVIEVRKRRWQYLLDLPAGEPAAMFDLAEDPYPDTDRGMALELAEIEAGIRVVWTLGIEAFPAGPDLGSDMLSAVLPLLRECPLGLTFENSSGYPAWLVGIGAS